MIVDHSPAKVLKKSPPHDLDILFASYPDPSQGGIVPVWRSVPATVFAEALPLPTSDDWIVYEKESASVFYAAELTTVENKWYGVEAGMRVRAPTRPNLELGGLMQGCSAAARRPSTAASSPLVLREQVRAAGCPAG